MSESGAKGGPGGGEHSEATEESDSGVDAGTGKAGPGSAQFPPSLRATPIGFLVDLLRPDVRRVAIGNEATVPAGLYAVETLKKFGMYNRVKDKLIRAETVRQVLEYVASGAVDAGFVFSTDVLIGEPVRVIARVPRTGHDPILYPIAPLADSEQRAAAERFVRFVLGPKGRAILLGQGFLMPPPPGKK